MCKFGKGLQDEESAQKKRKIFLIYRVYLFLFLLLYACTPQTPVPTITIQSIETPLPSATPTLTSSPVPPTPTLSPIALEPSITPGPIVCSPLDGITIAELPDLIHNPFAPPRLGSDDPHQGVDFADIDPVYEITLEGRSVQAVLPGNVAAIIQDRFPYGYAILVETNLAQVPPEWLAHLQIPTLAPTQETHPSLTCPEEEYPPNWDFSRRSIYLMYAHLKEPFSLQVGDPVSCGQKLNAIGNSGNSLNPHLHLETRIGPAGVSFESIAHYTGSASPQEMRNYCRWRVSETFQLINPMLLFSVSQ